MRKRTRYVILLFFITGAWIFGVGNSPHPISPATETKNVDEIWAKAESDYYPLEKMWNTMKEFSTAAKNLAGTSRKAIIIRNTGFPVKNFFYPRNSPKKITNRPVRAFVFSVCKALTDRFQGPNRSIEPLKLKLQAV